MKLSDVAPGRNRVFTAPGEDGTYSFVVKRVGTDGAGLTIWSGRMKKPGAHSMPVALAVHTDGTIVAINTASPEGAARLAVDRQRKGYGLSLVPELSWEVREYANMKLDHYHEDR